MPDLTVKRIEEFDTPNGGGFCRARATLGVSAFGMQVENFPPHFEHHPEHDHSGDGQEEVYTALSGSATLHVGGREYRLEPGVFARVGAGERAPGDDRGRAGAAARDRRHTGRGLPGAALHRGRRAARVVLRGRGQSLNFSRHTSVTASRPSPAPVAGDVSQIRGDRATARVRGLSPVSPGWPGRVEVRSHKRDVPDAGRPPLWHSFAGWPESAKT